MKTFALAGQSRADMGKKATKAVRKSGNIPAIIYGGEKEVAFSVKKDDVRNLIYTPDIFVVDLTIDGNACKAIVQALQFHPVTDELLHIDFLQVNEEKPILIEVPVKLDGLAEGVKQGGKLSLEIRKLKVKALYTNVPERLIIDVTDLGLGKTIQVGQLAFDNMELMNAKNAVVCAVKLTRAARGAQAAKK
ncbi:MAG: 50S ribosomal protein L25/general stress protein Ctc [Bacteroidales bacterium]|nr:50S ribosomal protein L25/general stress protein Ctc [Bacteroidales bacterium]